MDSLHQRFGSWEKPDTSCGLPVTVTVKNVEQYNGTHGSVATK